MMKWDLLLFPHVEVPPLQAVLAAEKKLLLFGRWLARDYASATVTKYVGEVKSAHVVWLGVPLTAMNVTFTRLPMLFRMIRKEKPGRLREKTPWEGAHFDTIRGAHGNGAAAGDFGAGVKGFERATAMTAMYLAYEQLLRLSELVRTQGHTAADKNPLQWSDVVFKDAEDAELGWDAAGKPMGDPVRMELRMPPSKTDQAGLSELVLRSPFPTGWRQGKALNAAGPAMWRYMRRFPVVRERAGITPLFRTKPTKGREVTGRLTKPVFQRIFRALCKTAGIPGKDYGIHCFRVGGVNRLMDLGATAPQICAMGRWQSDCWLLYARRQRVQLEQLTARMAGPEQAG
jgi:hypothetical protein